MMLKILVGVMLVVFIGAAVWLTLPTKTPAFVDNQGHLLPQSIATQEWIDINGLPQWTLMRGRDRNKPILLVLHGGPGISEFALFRAYNSNLENHFVVVHWDQRGTGMSFAPDTPVESINPEQYIADLDQLVNYLHAKFDRDRIALLGHSWGSILGIIYASRYPEKLSAYIGTGQVSDMRANEQISYQYTLAQAYERGNKKAITELEEIGPPPYSTDKTSQQRNWLNKFGGGVIHKNYSKSRLIRAALSMPETNIFYLISVLRGAAFTHKHMWDAVLAINLDKTYLRFEVPVFFLLGRHDYQTPAKLAETYFQRLQAPVKDLVYFEKSAHSPPWEEPERFRQVITKTIRPQLLPDRTQ